MSSWFLYVPSYVAMTTPVPRINFTLLFGLFFSGSSFFLIPLCKFSKASFASEGKFLFSEKFRMAYTKVVLGPMLRAVKAL